MPNKVIFSRIQNRRGPLENLPQPLRPGELALTSDARRLWIGNEDIAPFGIRTYTSAIPVDSGSLIQMVLSERIISVVFDASLSQLAFDQLVDFLSRSNNKIFPPFVPPSSTILVTTQTHANYDGSAPNGTFSGGTGYAIGNVITLTNGARVTVNNVSSSVVTQFTVTYRGGSASDGVEITQQSSSPVGGTGFSITPGANNTTQAPSPDKATFYNQTEQVLWDGDRSVFVGLRRSERDFAAEKDSNWISDPAQALEDILDEYPGGFPFTVNTVKIADDEFLPDWQGPPTQSKIRNFSNPALTTLASGNVAKLINLVAASSLILDTSQTHSNYNGTGDNGSFTIGVNYSVDDVITLSNNAKILVTQVDGSGSITGFSISSQGSQVVNNFTLNQTLVLDDADNIANGIGFSLTPNDNNVILLVTDQTEELVTTVSNIEIGLVDIFDETEFPSDLIFESFDYQVVLDNASATNQPTGISFPLSTSDSVFIEYTMRNAQYSATGNMRLSYLGGAIAVNDERSANSNLSGDITLTSDFDGTEIRVLYTNTFSPATDDIVLKMIVRRWISS